MTAASAKDIIAARVGKLMGWYGQHADTEAEAFLTALTAAGWTLAPTGKFKRGDRVTKISGSSWTGRVVGTYSTTLTPEGYAVESENEPGSVQIYPAAALRALAEAKP
jgi:dihydrofolate reductase (trimethoprim resistance protein)